MGMRLAWCVFNCFESGEEVPELEEQDCGKEKYGKACAGVEAHHVPDCRRAAVPVEVAGNEGGCY